MLDWFAQTPALVAAILVVLTPGLLIGWAAGLRGLALWAVATPLGTAALTGLSLLLGLFGVGWWLLPALIGTIVVALVAWALRFSLKLGRVPAKEPLSHPALRFAVPAGVAVGLLLVLFRVGLYIGDPSAISQTNDASFHLSALRFALETGGASPLELSRVIGAESFYPSAWHVLASLVAQLSGCSVEVAANVVSLAIAAIAWPLGIAYLTRAVAGATAAAVAAALAASVAAFPLLLVQWGILYPQLLAVAMLPAAIALVVDHRALTSGPGHQAARWARLLLLVAGAALAVTAAQPSVLLALISAVLAYTAWEVVARWRSLTVRGRSIGLALVVTIAVITAVLWWLFSRSVSVTWPPSTGRVTAVVEVIFNGFLGYPWAVGTSILMVIGLIVAVRTPAMRWLATLWVLLAGLYVVAASIGLPWLRGFLVGAWYEDPYRLAALVPVAAIPLAGIGAAVVAGWAAKALAPGRERTGVWAALGVVTIIGVISLAVSPQIARRDVFAHRIDPNLYTVTADSYLSADELALLERLDETVPADAVVIGNPSTGMALGYAISGRNVIPRTWSPPPGETYDVLWTSLRDVADDPAVCPALEAFGAEYVLDFGPGEEYPGRWIMPGFTNIDGQSGFELVDREGAATLWRVTACD
ncbi:MAG TPA: DUF6541 family protein [Microbacterium sp.]|nr:DUF6541 family protein [Microbacterium sp.]